MMRARAILLAALLLSVPGRALATDKLLAAFHFDVEMGTFIMADDRAFGRDASAGSLRYFDPYFSIWITGGVQVRPHPILALDLQVGFAQWTGRAWDTQQMDALCWIPEEVVFRARNRLVPLELTLAVSLVEAPKVFLAIAGGPGFYTVFRRTKGKASTTTFSKGYGAGGKLALLIGFRRSGAFEFNIEIGFRLTRITKMKGEDGVTTGDFRPDFSGPFLGLRFLFGGGSADPAAEPEPAPPPATPPVPPTTPSGGS